MIGKFSLTFVGQAEPTRKGSIEVSFIIGTMNKEKGLFGGGLVVVNAWTKEALSLKPFGVYPALVDITSMGGDMTTRLQSIETDKGVHRFYESAAAADMDEIGNGLRS
jgi:hypothetical protein